MYHRWTVPQRFAASCFEDGCARNFRTCERCGLVRITVIPPDAAAFPWLEWQRGCKRWRAAKTPPCETKQEREAAHASG